MHSFYLLTILSAIVGLLYIWRLRLFELHENSQKTIDKFNSLQALCTLDTHTGVASFQAEAVSELMEKFSREVAGKVESSWWYPRSSRISQDAKGESKPTTPYP